MKKFFSMFAVAMIFGFAGTASATDVPDIDTWQMNVGNFSMFSGEVSAGFTGGAGYNNITKVGGATSGISANLSGDLCGSDCLNGGVESYVAAEEHIGINGDASGNNSDELVSSENLGIGQIGLGLTVGNDSVMLGAQTGFAGVATGGFKGADGNVITTQSGYSSLVGGMDYSGGGCSINCGNGSFNLSGVAGETVTSAVNASGGTSGSPVTAINGGMATTNIQLMLQK